MIIKKAVDEFVLGNKKAWKHDRSRTVGASEIGQCERKVFYAKSGEVGEDQSASYGAALRGNLIEDYVWAPALKKKYGTNFLFGGKEQRTLERGYLSATPDGLLVNLTKDFLAPLGIPDMGSEELIVEQKSIDPRVNLTKEKDEHYFQTQCQMGLLRELTEYQPNYALISYIDASFLHEISEYVIPFDQKVYEQAHNRATRILTATRASELRPEGWIAGGKDCEYCPFVKQCGVERRSVPDDEPTKVDPQIVAEMTDLCREYKAAKLKEEDIGKEVRDIQEKIKERLRESNIRRIPKVVSWTSQKGRESYNIPALKIAAEKAGVDVESFSTVGDPTDRLMVLLK